MQEGSVLLQHLQNIWVQNHMLRHHLLPWGQLHWPCISWARVYVLNRQHALFGTVECLGRLWCAGEEFMHTHLEQQQNGKSTA